MSKSWSENGGQLNLEASRFSDGHRIQFQSGSSGRIVQSELKLIDLQPHSDASLEFKQNSYLSGSVNTYGDPGVTFDFSDNWWGTTNTSLIDNRIVDDANDPDVDYLPILTGPPSPVANLEIIDAYFVDADGSNPHLTPVVGEQLTIETAWLTENLPDEATGFDVEFDIDGV